MIRLAEVRRFAAQQHVDIAVAVQEVVLTILLRRIALSSLGDRLAFKGGTALRKIVFGAAGRFSEDLDFACLDPESELVQLELLDLLTTDPLEDEVEVHQGSSELAGSGTLQARFSFRSPIGEGRFELDVTSADRSVLLGAVRQPLAVQPYFRDLGYPPPDMLSVRPVEMATEKLAAIHRRFENRNPKDLWDLWKWFSLCQPADAQLVGRLWPARLWLDGLADGTRWRGPGWIERLDARQFNWDRLRPLLPANQRLQGDQIIRELKARIGLWVDDDSDGVLNDVGDGRRRAHGAVEERIQAVRQALGRG